MWDAEAVCGTICGRMASSIWGTRRVVVIDETGLLKRGAMRG